MPVGANGSYLVTIIGTGFVPSGTDGTGEDLHGHGLGGDSLPLGVAITGAGRALGDLTFTDIITTPPSGGEFTVTGVIPVTAAVGEMSLYVTRNDESFDATPFAISIYQVTAVAVVAPFRARPGARRSFFA